MLLRLYQTIFALGQSRWSVLTMSTCSKWIDHPCETDSIFKIYLSQSLDALAVQWKLSIEYLGCRGR